MKDAESIVKLELSGLQGMEEVGSIEWLTRRVQVLSTKQGNHRKLEVKAEHVSGMTRGLWCSGAHLGSKKSFTYGLQRIICWMEVN